MKAQKENAAIAEMLMVEGLDCRGFGNIYQFVMKDTDLHIYAKAIYAFLCSYSGGGAHPYPKRDTITGNLMSKSSYYKYLQQLIDNGYIRLEKANTFPFKTTYILLSNPKKLQEYQKCKSADTGSGRLRISGLKSEGYGSIPRAVMLDNRLTPQAKAIYAYLRSLSGMDGVAFPSLSDILVHLNIGRSTYNRHFRLLISCNYIECVQRREGGRFDVIDYYIVDNPDESTVQCEKHRVVKFRTSEKTADVEPAYVPDKSCEEADTAAVSPCSQIWDIEERDADTWDTEEWDTINNSNTKNSFINNSSYQSYPAEVQKNSDGDGLNDRKTKTKNKATQAEALRERESYAQIIRDNISYDILSERTDDRALAELLPLILDVMVDAVTSDREFHRVNGQSVPHESLKSRLLKINESHVEYIALCMSRLTTPIKSIRSYLLTSLYNAPVSIDPYYTQLVQADMHGHSDSRKPSYDIELFIQKAMQGVPEAVEA